MKLKVPNSDFYYTVNVEDKSVHIVDLNLGLMSVTNNIENILTYIQRKQNVFLYPDYKISYDDSEGEITHVEIISEEKKTKKILEVKFLT